MQFSNGPVRGIGPIVAEKCNDVRQNCRMQRENLAVQRVALSLRRDWHNLPPKVKRQFFEQLVIDRAVWKLIEASSFAPHRKLTLSPRKD
jgi:hypothetical protein